MIIIFYSIQEQTIHLMLSSINKMPVNSLLHLYIIKNKNESAKRMYLSTAPNCGRNFFVFVIDI